jgi:hypothetical protein
MIPRVLRRLNISLACNSEFDKSRKAVNVLADPRR